MRFGTERLSARAGMLIGFEVLSTPRTSDPSQGVITKRQQGPSAG
jgi:hypothetical protein